MALHLWQICRNSVIAFTVENIRALLTSIAGNSTFKFYVSFSQLSHLTIPEPALLLRDHSQLWQPQGESPGWMWDLRISPKGVRVNGSPTLTGIEQIFNLGGNQFLLWKSFVLPLKGPNSFPTTVKGSDQAPPPSRKLFRKLSHHAFHYFLISFSPHQVYTL